jgi:hypothetical protein
VGKSKYSPALFEVMNRQRNTGKMAVPKWWKGLRATENAPANREDGSLGPAEDSQPAAAAQDLLPIEHGGEAAEPPSEGQASPAIATASPGNEPAVAVEIGQSEQPRAVNPPPLLRICDGRAWISMNPIQGCVACGLLLVALIVSFELGRGLSGSVKDQPGTDALSDVLNQTPNPSVLDSPGNAGGTSSAAKKAPAQGGSANASVAGSVERPSDKTPAAAQGSNIKVGQFYVMLDRYPRDARRTGEHVQKWLASTHKIETMLVPKGGYYCLVASAGFDDRGGAEQFSERIKALGKECRKELIKAELPVYGFASPLVQKLEN